jgi:hypothetical protein
MAESNREISAFAKEQAENANGMNPISKVKTQKERMNITTIVVINF